MNLLPSDIVEDDMLPPKDFLDEVVQEFSEKFRSVKAEILIQEHSDRTVLGFVLRDIYSGAGTLLFDVTHLKDKPYPAAISPPNEDLPTYLRRKTIIPGVSSITGAMVRFQEHLSRDTVVENQWVCATPHEFRTKLKNVLNLDEVKVRMVAAISMARRNSKQDAVPETSAS